MFINLWRDVQKTKEVGNLHVWYMEQTVCTSTYNAKKMGISYGGSI